MQVDLPIFYNEINQNEEFVLVDIGTHRKKVRLHDYKTIFSIPELYEKVIYEILQSESPEVVTNLLTDEITKSNISKNATNTVSGIKALDLGAGNGIVGEKLKNIGVKCIYGIDILEEAKEAATSDRPGIYKEYYVTDISINDEINKKIEKNNINCLVSVATLGFNDIPPVTFAHSFNLIKENSWVAFTIKEDFHENNDLTGFSDFIKALEDKSYLKILKRKKYIHRKSITGDDLFYIAIIAKKLKNIPEQVLQFLENDKD